MHIHYLPFYLASIQIKEMRRIILSLLFGVSGMGASVVPFPSTAVHTNGRHRQPNGLKVAANKQQVAITATAASASAVGLNGFELCLAGAFATVFGDFVMHPVDTIKAMQISHST